MKVVVEFELDSSWDDYKNYSDDIIWCDLVENNFVGMDGVYPKLIKIDRD